MKKRQRQGSVVANPILIGAVTTLVVTVGVFLAYNANKGLPFVPTTALTVKAPSGANLLPGNEIREGGQRIGVVDDMKPVKLASGKVGAEISLKLDKVAGRLPKDSTINLRPRSVLGLKYVEITRGNSDEMFADGATMPADQVTFPVELDDLYNTFDAKTRRASQQNLEGFGNAFALRGVSLNETIADAPRFLRHLEPVARVLSDKDTNIRRFFGELGDAARIVSPVADRYAHSFTAGADTFEAWSRHPEQLKATISKSWPTMDVGIKSFRAQQPFLREFRDFSGSLERASAVLPSTLPRITSALKVGTPVVRRSAEINLQLRDTLVSLEKLMVDPKTGNALRGITRLTGILNPLLRFVGPYVTVCNYFNYSFSNVGEHVTEPDPTGTSQRTLLNQAPRPIDPRAPNLGSIGARQPVNGEPVMSGVPANLHSNVYSAAITHQGTADCESGQRGYLEKLTTYNDDPNLKIVTDPHIPGAQGPTFTGRERVPKGQTFTRLPESGPKMPKELDK